jgi:hypothetical protein
MLRCVLPALLVLSGAAAFRVEVLSTSPFSLINASTPGVTQNISGGFETGLVIKIDDGSYHMFAAAFPPGPDWGSDILVHWASPDGLTQWHPVQELAHFHQEGNLYLDCVSPMPWYNTAESRWEMFFMWQSQPMPDRWTANGTAYRMISQTPGRAGINGPWVQDDLPVLAHKSDQAWEDGMQDSISFPFFAPASNQWLVFYGSGPQMCCADWLVGLAAAATPSGPFTRLPTGNPVTLLPPPANMNYTENPTVFALPNNAGFVAVFDPLYDEVHTGRNVNIGFGFSLDGVTWLPEEGAAVPVVAPGAPFWAQVIRTPLGMVDEGDGTWSVFYTARAGNWDGLGVTKVRFVV